MLKRLYIILALLMLPIAGDCKIAAYFSPYDSCEKVWLDELSKAKHEVLISCYGLTNEKIYEKLLALDKSGVSVVICVDKTQSSGRSDKTKLLQEGGVEVVVKQKSALEHNKFAVIDCEVVLTGSWNLSASADKQDNNMIVISEDICTLKKFHSAWLRIYRRDAKEPLYDGVLFFAPETDTDVVCT